MNINYIMTQLSGKLENARQRHEAAKHDLEAAEKGVWFANRQIELSIEKSGEETSVTRWWRDELEHKKLLVESCREQESDARKAYDAVLAEMRDAKREFREFVMEG